MCKMSVCLNNLFSYNQTWMENKEGEMHWLVRVRHACQPSGGAVLHKTKKAYSSVDPLIQTRIPQMGWPHVSHQSHMFIHITELINELIT